MENDKEPKKQEARLRNIIRRGDEVNVTHKDPTMHQSLAAIGWDVKDIGSDLDLDVSVFILDKDEMTRVDEDFVFYNNPVGCDGAVKHTGDNRTGAGDGDDETILVDLNGIPFSVSKLVFVISIYDGDMLGQDFTMVRNVYFRLVNQVSNHELFKYEMDKELGNGTAVIIGELERFGPNWVFRAIGENIKGGLGAIASDYGIIIAQHVQA